MQASIFNARFAEEILVSADNSDVPDNKLTQKIDLFGGSMFLFVPPVPLRPTSTDAKRATAVLERDEETTDDWDLPRAA